MYYVEYNPNPQGKKVGDCVVRAICKATGMDWDIVFMDLCEIAFDEKCMPNEKDAYEKYIIKKGLEWRSIKVTKGSKRPTVKSFAKDHPQGTYIMRVANHLVTVQDGKYYDLWDSGECCVYGYWERV